MGLLTDKIRHKYPVTEHGDDRNVGAHWAADDIDAAGIEARVSYLEDWLESRGLPKDWTGQLDAWGWVATIDSEDLPAPKIGGVAIGVTHVDAYSDARKRYGRSLCRIGRWDTTTSEQRAEALRITAKV